ncbi:phosphatidate cytidylyltransferase [Thermodesulfobacteriota bacterium]
MHLKRWLTAIVILPVLIYLIGFVEDEYRWIFYSVLCLFSLAGLNEYYRITTPDLPLFVKIASNLLTILLFASLIMKQGQLTMSLFPFFILLPMIYYLFADPIKNEHLSSDIAKAVLGPFYVCLPLALLIPIDLQSISPFYKYSYDLKGIWIFFLLAIIFANDTGAYYGGKLFGKHKLYRSVSPKKTWEGAICGVILALFISILFLKLFKFHPVDPAIVAVILILSVAGQVGDLAESMLKRSHNIKDSGALLPGHGGVLDRIDSLLFAIPVLYIFLQITIK